MTATLAEQARHAAEVHKATGQIPDDVAAELLVGSLALLERLVLALERTSRAHELQAGALQRAHGPNVNHVER